MNKIEENSQEQIQAEQVTAPLAMDASERDFKTQDSTKKDKLPAQKKTAKEELLEIKEALCPVKTPDFADYPKWLLMVMFVVYYGIYCGVWLMPNPGITKMIVDFPLLLLALFLFRKVLIHDFKSLKANYKPLLMFLILGFVVHLLFEASGALLTGLFTEEVPPNAQAAVDAFASNPAIAFGFGLICMNIGAPVMEELMFRRALRLHLKNRVLFFAVSSILFGIAHIVVGFSFPIALAFAISYIFSGLGFAFLYERTNNLWIPISVHALINIIASIREIAVTLG